MEKREREKEIALFTGVENTCARINSRDERARTFPRGIAKKAGLLPRGSSPFFPLSLTHSLTHSTSPSRRTSVFFFFFFSTSWCFLYFMRPGWRGRAYRCRIFSLFRPSCRYYFSLFSGISCRPERRSAISRPMLFFDFTSCSAPSPSSLAWWTTAGKRATQQHRCIGVLLLYRYIIREVYDIPYVYMFFFTAGGCISVLQDTSILYVCIFFSFDRRAMI